MGIKNLTKVIADLAPQAIKEKPLNAYFGRAVAVDASMSMYQFLIAVRQEGSQLSTESGEVTSHLMGMFYRTIRMITNGIKPIYVFDGKPPVLKSDELGKRKVRRTDAKDKHVEAFEIGDTEAIDKYSRRLVHVTKEQTEECKKVLQLMGVPYIDAPGEAEAQCAAMVKAKLVFAAATDDMDTLTFGSDIVLRHVSFSEAKKMPIKEIHLSAVLQGLEFTHEEFVDLCILLGCDYCESIKGIGMARAVDLVKKYRNLEEIIAHIDKTKYQIPEDWPFQAVRKLFLEPDVSDCSNLQVSFQPVSQSSLIAFKDQLDRSRRRRPGQLFVEREKFRVIIRHCLNFNYHVSYSEDRVRSGAAKLRNARRVSTQTRIDSFFKVSAAPPVQKARWFFIACVPLFFGSMNEK
ncbi:XPG protein [Trichuris suis]|nr:XPG protein [Trichuris suis]